MTPESGRSVTPLEIGEGRNALERLRGSLIFMRSLGVINFCHLLVNLVIIINKLTVNNCSNNDK